MSSYDLIPDIHGQTDKLTSILSTLGYFNKNGSWRHSDADRKCIFLGDYIDRGAGNRSVLGIVRGMVEEGSAQAIMGNHELNAIHYHTMNPETGVPLRAWSKKNNDQHASFLDEFPVGSKETFEQISWMQTLPLFLELDDFRVVHACWNSESIEFLNENTNSGVLSGDQFVFAADPNSEFKNHVDITAKGPEVNLPGGATFNDKQGAKRSEIRVKWWNSVANTCADLSMSVPDPSELPTSPLPSTLRGMIYPSKSKPVFFGHYWLTGSPKLQAHNVLCLDYSAGKDGPLMAYTFEAGSKALNLAQLSSTTHSP